MDIHFLPKAKETQKSKRKSKEPIVEIKEVPVYIDKVIEKEVPVYIDKIVEKVVPDIKTDVFYSHLSNLNSSVEELKQLIKSDIDFNKFNKSTNSEKESSLRNEYIALVNSINTRFDKIKEQILSNIEIYQKQINSKIGEIDANSLKIEKDILTQIKQLTNKFEINQSILPEKIDFNTSVSELKKLISNINISPDVKVTTQLFDDSHINSELDSLKIKLNSLLELNEVIFEIKNKVIEFRSEDQKNISDSLNYLITRVSKLEEKEIVKVTTQLFDDSYINSELESLRSKMDSLMNLKSFVLDLNVSTSKKQELDRSEILNTLQYISNSISNINITPEVKVITQTFDDSNLIGEVSKILVALGNINSQFDKLLTKNDLKFYIDNVSSEILRLESKIQNTPLIIDKVIKIIQELSDKQITLFNSLSQTFELNNSSIQEEISKINFNPEVKIDIPHFDQDEILNRITDSKNEIISKIISEIKTLPNKSEFLTKLNVLDYIVFEIKELKEKLSNLNLSNPIDAESLIFDKFNELISVQKEIDLSKFKDLLNFQNLDLSKVENLLSLEKDYLRTEINSMKSIIDFLTISFDNEINSNLKNYETLYEKINLISNDISTIKNQESTPPDLSKIDKLVDMIIGLDKKIEDLKINDNEETPEIKTERIVEKEPFLVKVVSKLSDLPEANTSMLGKVILVLKVSFFKKNRLYICDGGKWNAI